VSAGHVEASRVLLEHGAAPQAPLTAALEQARYAGVPEPRLHALAELLRAHRRAAASHGPPLQGGAGRSACAEPPTVPAEHRRSLSWHGPISARAAPAAACAACAALAAARRPCTAACAAACTAACAAACAAAAPRPANASRQAAEAAAEEAASSLLAEVESERCVEAARAQARAARLAKRAQARAAPGLRAERGSGSSSSSGSGRCEDEGACEVGTSTSTSEAKARPASAPAAPAGPGIAQRLQARYGWRCELIGSALFFDGSDVDIVLEVPHSSSLAHAYEKVVLATGWVVAGTGTVDGQRL